MSKIKIIGNEFMLIEHSTSGDIILKIGEPNSGPTYEKYAVKIPVSDFQSMIEIMQEAQRVFGLAPKIPTGYMPNFNPLTTPGSIIGRDPNIFNPPQVRYAQTGENYRGSTILDSGFTTGCKYGDS